MDEIALTDIIHEAALVPSIWPAALDEIGDAVGGSGGYLFAVRDGYVSSINSLRYDETLRVFMEDRWHERDQTLQRAIARDHAGFLGDADLMTQEEMGVDQVYCGFFRKHGLDYRAGTVISMPVGDSAAFVFPRNQSQGPATSRTISFLDRLRPHLARAALTANRLGFERARAQADALQVLGLPGAMLRGQGRVFAANALFEALMPSLFQDRTQRLMLTDTTADVLLADALSALSLAGGRAIQSIPVGARFDRVPMVLHLVPVRGAAHDIFTRATALLVVTPVDRAAVPTAEVLQGLFDLTPAEARVARGIAQAQSVEALAVTGGVNRETIRTQLKAVLGKTGVSRQAELVALLAGKTINPPMDGKL